MNWILIWSNYDGSYHEFFESNDQGKRALEERVDALHNLYPSHESYGFSIEAIIKGTIYVAQPMETAVRYVVQLPSVEPTVATN